MQALSPRPTELGGFTIRRLLPQRPRRMVGAWCFLDLLGPVSVGGDRALDVPPHPHIGLQTVTWVLAGEALHKDSLGSEAVARPGSLNLMTSGGGIAHSEETPARGAGLLHLVQLWIAQPDADRNGPPSFDHHADRPVLELPGGRATVILGTLGGLHAPARLFSPLIGADLAVDPGHEVTVPLARGFEHALVPLAGRCAAEADALARDHLYYLEPGRDDWEAGRRFGEVRAYEGARLAAPRFLARPVPANPMS